MPEPLPSPGSPISINQIRNYYGQSTGSLRALSNIAGLSTPDAMSEFYSGGGGLNLFFISFGVNDPNKICIDNPSGCTPTWHNGSSALPDLGDTVYTDASGTTRLSPFKSNVFFGMTLTECESTYLWFKIASDGSGVVIDLGSCF
jgi:hypothetical protein